MPTTGPTPILPNGRLTINYSSNGIAHKLRMRCNWTTSVLVPFVLQQASGSLIAVQDAADMVFTLIAPLYKAAQATMDGWQLDNYSGGAYLPLVTGSTAVTPSDTANTQVAQQVTITFRDPNYKKVRFIFFEQRQTPAAKYSYSQLGGSYLDLVNSILDETDAGIGSWFCGRGDTPINGLSYLSLVSSYNRKLRRRRGLA